MRALSAWSTLSESVKKPPIQDAPDEWIDDIVESMKHLHDEMEIETTITSSEDDKEYCFIYLLEDIRAEYERRRRRDIVH